MSKKIVRLEDGSYQIQSVNEKTGAIQGADVFEAEKAMSADDTAKTIRAQVKRHGELRRAALTFCGLILAQKPMAGWQGKGDKTKGQPSKEMKASMRDALTMAVKVNAKAFGVAGADGSPDEERTQTFLSVLREDKNFANVQTVALKYWVFCGKSPVTDKGFLVPVPVMMLEIAEALDVPAVDTSIAGQIVRLSLLVENRTEKTKIEGTEYGIPSAVAALKSMLATFEGLEREAAERATANLGSKAAKAQENDPAKIAGQAVKVAADKAAAMAVAAPF